MQRDREQGLLVSAAAHRNRFHAQQRAGFAIKPQLLYAHMDVEQPAFHAALNDKYIAFAAGQADTVLAVDGP